MWAVPCFLAILTSKNHSDVIQPFETFAAALAQCHAWTAHGAMLRDDQTPGYAFHSRYGTARDTVRVEVKVLVLTEPADPDAEEDDSDADPMSEALTPADRRFLRVVETLTPQERGAVRPRGLEGEDA